MREALLHLRDSEKNVRAPRELYGPHVLNERVERGDNSGRVKGGHLQRNV